MYRSDDRSIKAEHNLHKYYSTSYTDNRLQYGIYRLVEVNVRPIIYNA